MDTLFTHRQSDHDTSPSVLQYSRVSMICHAESLTQPVPIDTLLNTATKIMEFSLGPTLQGQIPNFSY